MALTMQVQQVTEEEDGTYTVYINFIDDVDARILGKLSIQGQTKQELKDKLRPKWQTALVKYGEKTQLKNIAQAAVNELMQE